MCFLHFAREAAGATGARRSHTLFRRKAHAKLGRGIDDRNLVKRIELLTHKVSRMNETSQISMAMLTIACAALMLVAGQLYLENLSANPRAATPHAHIAAVL